MIATEIAAAFRRRAPQGARAMTGTDRYVPTTDIRAAIRGRETYLFDALGIDWRSGRPHIRCPYRDHADDNASWRWDAKHGKARCTCTKGDSIFDVVTKVEGRDFESAKVRVAEILKRDDLIRTKGDPTGGPKYQSTDAASLLSAPAERRDDSLPIAYLAYRLNVPLDAVPIPCTRMRGLKALGYFDPPPAGSKVKPKLVGEFPCAVFETIGADGRTHAHRIYLAEGGRGKADLGTTPSGRPREAKKSAKIIGDDNIAGRSVLWGDPCCAPHIVVVEGVETGAAVALAFIREIRAGEIAVAAAISATGIEAFEPYLVTVQVTVAADRDEAPKSDGRPGSHGGGKAARTLGLRHYERLKVAIALPGATGESTDWLDVLLRDGPETVRAGILAAIPFMPTHAELESAIITRGRAAELKEIAATYPLPVMDTMTLTYEHTAAGKVKVHRVAGKERDPETGRIKLVVVPIATPFGVPARLRYVDQANTYGLRCVVQDMIGQPRAIDFDRAGLAKMGAADIRSMMFSAGLRTEADGEMIAVQCLKAADPVREILVVRRPGWHEIAGCKDPIFVAPNGAVFGVPDGLGLELATAVCMAPDVAKAGSLDGWRAAVATAISVARCEHWTLGVLAAFAGPIVALTGLDTCGINLSGLTTSGKSTAQRLAASAWSSPDIRRPGLSQSARSTDNAVEALAQRATGTILSLDELAHLSGQAVAKMIYTIAGNIGKRRMTADARVRDTYAWATFAILSGECSLEEKVRGDGGQWLAGMAVRIVDIDVTGVDRQVDAATLQRINDIEYHYGHAGPAFVRALIERGLHRQSPALRDRILKATRALAGGDMDSATVRAAMPLALLMIAGELAKNFGLIPAATAVKEAVRWAWDRFRQSSDAAALDPEAQTVARLRTWIAERWGVTIISVDAENGINNREAVAWFDDVAIYVPKGTLREAAGSSVRESEVASILARRGLIAKRTEADRLYLRFVPKVGRVEAYALSRSHFGRCGDETDPDTALTVRQGGRNG